TSSHVILEAFAWLNTLQGCFHACRNQRRNKTVRRVGALDRNVLDGSMRWCCATAHDTFEPTNVSAGIRNGTYRARKVCMSFRVTSTVHTPNNHATIRVSEPRNRSSKIFPIRDM